MFTGIIEELGEIKSVRNGKLSSTFVIKGSKVLNNTNVGDSIATNGVCLTVTNLGDGYFEADVMAETLRKSNLGDLNIGSKVNLERALSFQGRLGGHIVSGHIDGTGSILSFVKEDNAIWVSIRASGDILRYVVYKGSITIDGISLTVSHVDDDCFKVCIIPHTANETTLLSRKIGDFVNLECDLIGKYVEKLLGLNNNCSSNKVSNISEDFLKENGFF